MTKKLFHLNSVKLLEANLEQYAMAVRSAEGDSFEEIAIRNFFEQDIYTSICHPNVASYTHNKWQWVFSKFWEDSLGFKKVRETNFGWTDEIPPKKTEMEIDIKKTIQIYSDVLIFFEKEQTKVVLSLSHNDHNNSYDYEIFFQEDKNYFTKWQAIADECNFYKNKKIDASCRFLDLKSHTWDDVILSQDKKVIIQSNINGLFKHRDQYREFGIPVKRGIILHGPPGTGKTQVCKALASTSLGYSVLYVLPKDFDSQSGGVSRIAKMAQDLAPCLMIIEDIDFVAKDRALGNAGVVIELMNYLDGLEEFGDIVTFGTTNHLDVLEDAIKNRPGRFDRIIEIGKPEQDERIRMIKAFTSKFDTSQIDMNKMTEILGSHLENLSGAHIKDLCLTAAGMAVRAGSILLKEGKNILVLKGEHFKEALKEVSEKDYASYANVQSKSAGNFGFGSISKRSLLDYDDELE